MKFSNIQIFSLAILFLVSCNEKQKKEKTIKRTQSETEFKSNPLKESVARGRLVYNDFCITCHMASGEGVANVFPPMAVNPSPPLCGWSLTLARNLGF